MSSKPSAISPVAAARAVFAAQAPSPFAHTSPFAAMDPTEVPEGAPEGSYTYALVQQAPAVAAEECETSAEAVEIVVRFGASVLAVKHLSPARSFVLGDEDADVAVAADALGAAKLPLVDVDAAGHASLVIPASAKGSIALPGQRMTPVADALASSGAPFDGAPGARSIALAQGLRAELEIAGLSITVAGVHAGKKVAGRGAIDAKSLPYQGLSFLLHGALLAATAFFMPPMAMADEGGVDADQKYMIQQALEATAPHEQDAVKEDTKVDDAQPDTTKGGSGQRAAGSEGKAGSQTSKNSDGRFGIYGDKSNKDLMPSRSAALDEARTFGMISVLTGSQGPTAPWGAEVAVGNDPKTANGNMWGSTIDDAAGNGALGLSGIGEGGGCANGSCLGIGLGNVGTVGHGSGLGDGQGFGDQFGHGHARLGNAHKVAVPVLHAQGTTVDGRLPSEVIQRVVRQNFGRFRLCYENGLRANPNLQGRVAVRFVIGRDGGISQVASGGSDIADSAVTSCVTRAFYGLSFPAPESGIVTVTYPIVFSPGG
jgi:hypothetical protein